MSKVFFTMQLKPGTKLQGGKIEIIRTLGQGGFGITYEAEQVLLGRKYALKEFFMKDCCERDDATSFVTVGTGSQRNLVEKFRGKFIREARMMAGLDHPHIVRVLDVFEENGTAYYVMENLPGGSLSDKVKKDGPLSEDLAEKYIRQVADALAYIHSQNTVHLDVKPSNILLNAKGDAVLIDFGISKHYDDAGEQTSSTPVGISKGYAPLEQGRDGDISQFKPSTDIYALGATLYYLVTGSVPPEASIVNEDGLNRPKGVSDKIWNVIEQAMQPRRKDRPQTVEAFLALLDADSEVTIVDPQPKLDPKPKPVSKPKPELKPVPMSKPAPKSQSPKSTPEKQKSKTWLWTLLGAAAVVVIIAVFVLGGRKEKPIDGELTPPVESTAVAEPAVEQTTQVPAPEPVAPGSLKVTSTPSGATIWLDKKKMRETTPATLSDLTPGKHTVGLVLEGYNDLSGTVTITSGKQTDWSKTLTAKEKPVLAENSSSVGQLSANKINGHEWVDLGVGVKWATCNVGATKPENYGSYFAWGDIKPKSEYTWTNYKFRVTGNSWNNVTLSKYNTDSNRGTVDNKETLDLSDDAARANWGGTWRMPTYAEMMKLRTECDWKWTTQGGKKGYKVTGKNGNSIFLPAAGDRDGTGFSNGGSYGEYWSSSLHENGSYYAWSVIFSSDGVGRGHDYRCCGFSVRPVSD